MKRRSLLAGAGALAAAPLIDVPAAQAGGAAQPASGRKVMTGAEVLAKDGWRALAGQKVGVISNPTGILPDFQHIVDTMHASGKVNIAAVFGPEHGFRGSAQAGGSEGDHIDPRTGIMVYDAYGANADKLAGLYTKAGVETVVFDIQDVGARFYTYIWTMFEAMLAAVRTGAKFVVLDRPNPVGGYARGPMLKPGYTSGVGKKEIVQQHGMTVGELARMFNAEYLPLEPNGGRLKELQVIQASNWKRDQLYDDTGLTWVMPSPNMPTPDTALVYPGLCLFEATNMSEGRGTTRPFELIGAPYVDYKWAEALQTKNIPGVAFREAYFTPTISKNANVLCGGVQVQITDPHRIEAITAATHMIVEARKLYPEFTWREETPPGRWIDLLTGSDRFRTMLLADATAEEIVAAWKSETDAWTARRAKYLLYKGAHR
ncbi:exo-beta-N-acetylmuramidase NamZ domain-containing protein [Kribbella sp. NPDC051586]|uniref:exo-beta-N-acetylmuramidase NamZ family protein n=1 Tax=Kribbella sp. NPDC051586 TaxID=3364118 RepID=UPI0037BBDBA0